ncbi:chaperonin 10-like protein [Pterulicium gracile]|uniref:Chaperonin 10-like protein n=1 Tax=Pterulicium gracile TaxID=1884261 RepID=A0A5C3QUT5_9AGAR|nr:chaperonin 10-like protein [Pterula gracilis]
MSPHSQIPPKTRAYNIVKSRGGFTNGNMNIIEAASPSTPQADEVLVKAHAVSLNGHTLRHNLVPTSDTAFEIIAVGPSVKGWKVGQRVCANFCPDHIHGENTSEGRDSALGAVAPGVLTEYRTFPAHSLVVIPEHLSYEEASTLPCAGLTAHNALLGSKPIKGGDVVLVLGTGGISIFALQIAVASGAVVIATSSSDEKLRCCVSGVKHVIEVGGSGTLIKSINSIRIGGSVGIIGSLSSEGADPAGLIGPIMMHSANVRGIMVGSVEQFKDFNRLLDAQIKPVVDKVFDFEQAVDAYTHLESQKHIGNVVIKVAKN